MTSILLPALASFALQAPLASPQPAGPATTPHSSNAQSSPRYTVVAIPELPGGLFCSCMTPTAISNAGDIAGRYFSPADQNHAFSIVSGTARDLGTFGGDRSSASAINNLGQSVGVAQVSEFVHRAFVESGGVLTQLPNLGGILTDASDINDAGVIVGLASGQNNLTRAAVWGLAGDQPLVLPTFGGELSNALAINEAGVVVGWAWNADRDKRAFSWTADTGLTDLGALAAGTSQATDINNAGQIVGFSSINDGAFPDLRAVIFDAGVATDLGLVPETGAPGGLFGPAFVGTRPNAINNNAQVVGITFPRPDDLVDANSAVIWESGAATLLDTLIDPNLGWTLTDAFDINDSGVIVGTGRLNGEFTGFMLIPNTTCPADLAEPFGSLDFSDVVAFLAAFGAMTPGADLAPPFGVFDFSDVAAFLSAFGAGCP